MSGCIVNVATDSCVRGQDRLHHHAKLVGESTFSFWRNEFPPKCPPHRTKGLLAASRESDCVPYAFKAYAMKAAADAGHTMLLWADACIVPVKPLTELWEYIEREGVWFSRNGFTNYEWTAESAYPDLFGTQYDIHQTLDHVHALNKTIPHVVATTFGLNLKHKKGAAFLAEYYRLASKTRAFCGPWQNSASPKMQGRNDDRPRGLCGPPDVLGNRHDQTAASVIAWRLGIPLTDPPKFFAYEGGQSEETCLVARGI